MSHFVMQGIATSEIPSEYLILPEVIPFSLKEFQAQPKGLVLSFRKCNTDEWFDEFCNTLFEKVREKKFFPICRLSDGEYRFLFGLVAPSRRLDTGKWIILYSRQLLSRLRHGGRIRANTLPQVSSGSYSKAEQLQIMDRFLADLKLISDHGILAAHLTFFEQPFQEQYHPYIKSLIQTGRLVLNVDNYYPFYFVYALLTGSKSVTLIRDRRILIVCGAPANKRDSVRRFLQSAKRAREVDFLTISPDRSLFDTISVAEYIGRVDLIFVAAGVGKPNIFRQLKAVGVPCIDIGFVFEVWSSNELAMTRAYCKSDT